MKADSLHVQKFMNNKPILLILFLHIINFQASLVGENVTQESYPKYPYKIHSMVDLRALTEYFYQDLHSGNTRLFQSAMDHLAMMEETHARLLEYIRRELPERAKLLKVSDDYYVSVMTTTLFKIGQEQDLQLLRSLNPPNKVVKYGIEREADSLNAALNRVKEGKMRFSKSNNYYDPSEYPPETSPLSKPIPPLIVQKEDESVPPPVKSLQQPTVKQSEPLPIPVENHSWIVWLLAVFAALSGLFWLMRKSATS